MVLVKPVRPTFISFPVLKNERIILREVQDSDLEDLIEISFYDGIPAKDFADAKIMNERIIEDYMNGESIHWLISSVSTGETLGSCGFYRGFHDDIGEIGYVLKKTHYGQGYMTEAVSLMLEFGWNKLHLKAIKAATSKDNQPSINVLTKAGFEISEIVDEEIVFIKARD